MNQVVGVWDTLDARKRIVVLISAIAMFALVLGLARVVNSPSMSLLYSGLDTQTSAQIVSALEGTGAQFDVRGNAVFVESGQRDQLRLTLAGQGLPANTNAGYELLDNLSGFATTSQMFDAAYWRAKEGELARTILASPNVASARVHIANPVNRPFDRETQPTASVTVGTGGGTLGVNQAKAIRYLVAAAVSGLLPEQVSVIDAANGIVLAAGAAAEDSAFVDTVVEKEANMRANLERLLAARVGHGNAIVEVSIDASMDSETITERVLDPDGRVAISSDNEETSSTSSGTSGGAVTVASNLPDGDVDASGGNNNASNNSTRARVNYEVSEVLRERVKRPGEIRRVSVAVLVNGLAQTDANGETTFIQREQAELDALRELVQTAIGFDAARGDIVTLESMEFTLPAAEGTLAEPSPLAFLAVNGFKIFQMVFLGIVAVALGMFVLKPILTAPPTRIIDSGLSPELTQIGPDGAALSGVVTNGEIEVNPEVLENQEAGGDVIDRLKDAVNDRADASRMLLQDWLTTSETAPKENV